MAFGASSALGVKNGEGSHSLKKDKDANACTASGVRKPVTASPSIVRKPERLDDRSPFQKQASSSNPSRRSYHSNFCTSSASSGARNSEELHNTPDMKQGKKRRRSLNELTEQTREVTSKEHDLEPVCLKRKILDARTYKTFFKMQRRKYTASVYNHDEVERLDMVSFQNKKDEGNSISQLLDGMIKNHDGNMGEECVLGTCEVNFNIEQFRSQVAQKCSVHIEQPPDQTNALVTSKLASASAGDLSFSSSDRKQQDLVGFCIACSKRKRVGIEAPKQVLCSCNFALFCELSNRSLDRGELKADVSLQHVEKLGGCTQLHKSSSDIQMDCQENICLVCKLRGNLLCCDGKSCSRCYHLYCLDPPLNEFPFGIWLCSLCTKKRIEFGVHSVSRGIDSIWDVREVEVSDIEGSRRQKQFLVKYRGLAHVHNHWVTESDLLIETPGLVSNFKQEKQAMKWNAQWTIPNRLLKKRLLMILKQQDEFHSEQSNNNLDCSYEWLIKWCYLDYEHCTWELENASFLSSLQGQKLIQEYETRHERAKRAFVLVDKSKKASLLKFTDLPTQAFAGTEDESLKRDMLASTNKLLESWRKCQHAIVFDEQERIRKIILFILSLSEACWPFIVISASSTLSHWKAEFMRLAPSLDVVIYDGNADALKTLRKMGFEEEGCCLLFQVLLSYPEAIFEDLQMFETQKWEAVIIDDCQLPEISASFKQMKMLITDLRVLLYNGPVKDTAAEYLNLLSLLDSISDLHKTDCSKSDLNSNDLVNLKERLSPFVVSDFRSEFSRYIEYWVPAQISNVQLEQYCSTLLMNSTALCSSYKNDHVGALHDILTSLRKCCDHPYIMDTFVQGLITKGLPPPEYLEVGVKACGKLQLLDKMLLEIKNRQLRALVLFQSFSGPEKVLNGDILDDFLRQRFGPDSYERIDGSGLAPSKKQTILNKFNKEDGRFVFLLENRACLPSIKLMAVDVIIIFSSDWNPANDIRLLHKISIESPSKQIKVFRLYSSFTLEEKVLILAKNNLFLECNLQNISRTSIYNLLMWGAQNLFSRLDEFHKENNLDLCLHDSSEKFILNDVVEEFLAILLQYRDNNRVSHSLISKVRQSKRIYVLDVPLIGEQATQLPEEQSQIFWNKLLLGKRPFWKFSTVSTPRSRKRVCYNEDSPEKQIVESGEVSQKRKKMGSKSVDPASLQPSMGKCEASAAKEGDLSKQANFCPPSHSPSTGITEKLSDVLTLEVSKLCDVLNFPEDVKVITGSFLNYVTMNHRVIEEPISIFHAFQISVCWIGASLLKHKIDKKSSLELAKQYLNFSCIEEEADSIYFMLRPMKENFKNEQSNPKELNRSKQFIVVSNSNMEQLNTSMNQSAAFDSQNIKVEIEMSSVERGTQTRERTHDFEIDRQDDDERSRKIQKKSKRQMKKLLESQKADIQKLHRFWEDKKVQLVERHKVDSTLIRMIHLLPSRIDKLKALEDEFATKIDKLQLEKEIHLKKLEAQHLAARNELQKDFNREHKNDGNNTHGIHWSVPDIPTASLDRPHDCTELNSIREVSIDGDEKRYEVTSSSDSINAPLLEKAGAIQSRTRGKRDQSKNCETLPTFVDLCTDTVDFRTWYSLSNGENVRQAAETTNLSHGTGNRNDGTACSIDSDNLLPLEELRVKSILAQPAASVADDDNCSLSLSFAEAQNRDAPIRGNDNTGECATDPCGYSQPSISVNVPLADCQPSYAGITDHAFRKGHVLSRNPFVENITSCDANQTEGDCLLSFAEIENRDAPIGGNSITQESDVPPLFTDLCATGDHATDPSGESQRSISVDVPLHDCQQLHGGVIDHSFCEGYALSSNPLVGNVAQDNSESQNDQSLTFAEIQKRDVYIGGNSITQENAVPFLLTDLSATGEPATDPCGESEPSIPADVPLYGCQPSCGGVTDHEDNHQTEGDSCPCPSFDATEMHPSSNLASRSFIRETNQLSARQVSFSPNVMPLAEAVEIRADVSNQAVLPPSVSGVLDQTCTACDLSLNVCSTQLVEYAMPIDPSTITPFPNQPSGEHSGSVNLLALPRMIEHIAETSQSIMLPVACLGAHEGPNYLSMESAFGASRMVASHFPPDPLQIELNRICQEIEQTTKVHEDLMLRLKSECEKEVEEVVAAIRNKYKAKQHDAEAAFLQKKIELNRNQSKVLMNKILAGAFRFKYQNISSRTPTRTRDLQQSCMPSQHVSVPSLPFSTSTQSRPPSISQMTPSATNLWSCRNVRAPAPHLQPYSLSASTPASTISLPRGIQHGDMALASFSHPVHTPRLGSPSAALVPLPTNHAGTIRSRAGSSEQSLSPRNLPASSAEFILHVDGQPNASQSNVSLSSLDHVPNLDPLISDLGTAVPAINSLPSSSAGGGVV